MTFNFQFIDFFNKGRQLFTPCPASWHTIRVVLYSDQKNALRFPGRLYEDLLFNAKVIVLWDDYAGLALVVGPAPTNGCIPGDPSSLLRRLSTLNKGVAKHSKIIQMLYIDPSFRRDFGREVTIVEQHKPNCKRYQCQYKKRKKDVFPPPTDGMSQSLLARKIARRSMCLSVKADIAQAASNEVRDCHIISVYFSLSFIFRDVLRDYQPK